MSESGIINTRGLFNLKDSIQVKEVCIECMDISPKQPNHYITSVFCVGMHHTTIDWQQLQINREKYDKDVWDDTKHNTKKCEAHIEPHNTEQRQMWRSS